MEKRTERLEGLEDGEESQETLSSGRYIVNVITAPSNCACPTAQEGKRGDIWKKGGSSGVGYRVHTVYCMHVRNHQKLL